MAPANSQASNSPNSRLLPGIAFLSIIFSALVAFEIFNFSTTEHALSDLLGELAFAGLPWATVLAFAFCGIDFAGIARLFTPEQVGEESKEAWYLFGAWLLAATMNATLTWWGVSIAITNHPTQSSSVLDPQMTSQVVPVFVAIMVWTIRILIIGTLSLAVDKLVHPGAGQRAAAQPASSAWRETQQRRPASPPTVTIPTGYQAAGHQARSARSSQSRAQVEPDEPAEGRAHARPEPAYHSLAAAGRRPRSGGASGSGGGSGSAGGSSSAGGEGSGSTGGPRRF